MKLARIKVDALKNFLFAFNKFIPSNTSQKPKQININGKKSFGLYLLTIIFSEKRGRNKHRVKFITLKNFDNIFFHHLTFGKLCIILNYIQAMRILFIFLCSIDKIIPVGIIYRVTIKSLHDIFISD